MQRRMSVGSTEEIIAGIWAEVLRVPAQQLSAAENFFDLGGDSMSVAQVMDRINTTFFASRPAKALRVTDFFAHTTVRALARRVCAADRELDGPPAAEGRAETARDAIAIVGMSGRFPGARSVDEYWENLLSAVESIEQFDDLELLNAGVSPQLLAHPSYVKRGAVLDGLESFDAEPFGLTAREAAFTCPQQRLLLECAMEALELGGYGDPARSERVGVFVGVGRSRYMAELFGNEVDCLESSDGAAAHVINASPAARLSYLLDLRGPSYSVETACSSSLVAVHQACMALLNGECELALAGGASARNLRARGYRHEQGNILSADGRCRPFDRNARGTVFTAGAGIVLLKRLADARADRDPIQAVIRGTAINNDGSAKAGYTAPSVAGQARAIKDALARAEVDARQVGFIETHGTATALGDPIEIAALKTVFAVSGRDEKCVLGAVKANIGHAEAAAGIAGLIKTALVVKHGRIPPLINFSAPNDELDLAHSPFEITHVALSWQNDTAPRIAGVSSFGIGGTNAHAVMEEPPRLDPGSGHRRFHLLPVSARSEAALRDASRNLAGHLRASSSCVADAAYTLQVGRAQWQRRRFVVCSTAAEGGEALERHAATSVASLACDAGSAPVVFMFPGEGSQHVEMLRGLYEWEPVFRETVDACAELILEGAGADIRRFVSPAAGTMEEAARSLDDPPFCQASLFAVEYALACLWRSWGVEPSVMIGHGLGEYVAACLANVLSVEDALRIVVARGRVIQALPTGAMLAVQASRAEVEKVLEDGCSIAAIDGPASVVVCGPEREIERIEARLARAAVISRRLRASRASHSPVLERALPELERVLGGVSFGAVRIPYVSNVRANLIDERTQVTAEYWLAHLREPVQFGLGIGKLLAENRRKIFLEVGPGRTLAALVQRMSGVKHSVIASARDAREPGCDDAVLLDALGQVWQAGGAVDWRGFNARNACRRVALPTYPFQRQRHWVERTASGVLRRATASQAHAGAGKRSAAPETSPTVAGIEHVLADIWSELLGRDDIGPFDDFFDLGGDSLLAVQLASKVRSRLGQELPLKQLFLHPTIAGLTELLVCGSSRVQASN